ncbi:hypothetical protein TYRP_013654 [Tyrophagus putrescentiae]|nr:hypothetical protein TYRP_013654 [Tyrophagus putrescentiae]
MKSSRAHYRPLFGVGVGRSPPFLVAALTIGLCILGVSYWRLALQYHDLEEQLKRLIQKRDSLEANQNFINKQLEIREENFSEAKVSLQKKEQEVEDLKKKQDQTGKELAEIKTSLEQIKQVNDKLKSDTTEKDHSVELLRSQNQALESDKSKLNAEIKELKEKLTNVTNTLNQHSSLPSSSAALNPNIPKPESAARNPVYKLVNPAAGKPETKVDINPPPPLPKPSNSNANQIAPPPEPKKNVPSEDKMKAEESKQNPDIIDPANIAIDDDMEKDDPGHGDAAHEDLEGAMEGQKEGKVDNSINYVADNSKNAGGLNNKNSQDNLIESIQNI